MQGSGSKVHARLRRAALTLSTALLLAQPAWAGFVQQVLKVVGTGAVGNAQQDYSAALSADGNTAIIGGYLDNGQAGEAWVFTRSNGFWSQQHQKLARATASLLVIVLAASTVQAQSTAAEQRIFPIRKAASNQAAHALPVRLAVTRTKSNLNNPSAPPFTRTVADRTWVAKLYSDILALPPLPSGSSNCPLDLGIRYHLDFISGVTSVLAADYEPSGCPSIRLSDGMVKSDPTGSFKVDFMQALGFSSDRQLFGFG